MVNQSGSTAPARDEIVAARPRRSSYDGHSRFPDTGAPVASGAAMLRLGITIALVVGPLIGVVVAGILVWGSALGVVDLVLAVLLYCVTGLGIALGFHRGLTHRSFRMRSGLRTTLAVAGSMAFEGAVIDWVATHRRHHAYTDQPGDPHSPFRYGTGPWAQVKGLIFAHVGWLLVNDDTPAERYAPDLLKDRGLRRIDAAFPALCVLSLALPFALGATLTGTWQGGLTAFVWAGLVRVALLQHVTWSVNSLCHMFGSRPYATRGFDRATNLWPLALLSFGESWHNGHHADPTCARHGRARYQLDIAASLLRAFERLGWVHHVHWPPAGRHPPAPRRDARTAAAPCVGATGQPPTPTGPST